MRILAELLNLVLGIPSVLLKKKQKLRMNCEYWEVKLHNE